ncbi:Lipocalin-like domain-containing protein [Salegentibacter echinorum]|uniref:Lipocalin-like domain-containing protein n=1 Tax=Salegentibacter echinorum TaxID=1073325 RepID=A0A1M5BTU8_SALEC|nr:lipocalin family protein [Salegentibacter echinorum]SHF45928.1 Lipocalin-like domain-containing protein [Salegentibacter echinorum]
MKKLFLMLFSIALLTSCSDDDDVNAGDEKILGTWFVAEANGIPDFELEDCNRESFIEFNSDNTTYSEYYTQTGEDCTREDTTESVWSVNSGIYNFNLPFDLDGFENVQGTINFNSDLTEFTFTPTLLPSASIVFEKR